MWTVPFRFWLPGLQGVVQKLAIMSHKQQPAMPVLQGPSRAICADSQQNSMSGRCTLDSGLLRSSAANAATFRRRLALSPARQSRDVFPYNTRQHNKMTGALVLVPGAQSTMQELGSRADDHDL